jgi:putative flippase GtrA
MRIAGRLLTFALVGLLAALLGAGIAVALGAVLLLAGMSEANAYALALQLMPVIWAALAFAVLMQPSRRGQFKVLAFASVPVWPTLAAGVLA